MPMPAPTTSAPPPSVDPADAPAAVAPPPAGHELALAWARANPQAAAIVGASVVTLAAFFFAVPLFYAPGAKSMITSFQWIWSAWNKENHYEHGPMVPFIILFLIWNALPKLRVVSARSSWHGLVPLAFGVGLYLLAARSLQPRFAWAGLPFMLWGGVLYAAGWRWARTLLFPIACVFFLIPVPGIDQSTVALQVMATKAATFVCNCIGIKMTSFGTTMHAVDESFQFQVIGDCSGINSLMAITLMTAVFAHLTQDTLWKKLALFAASVPVAIIGNIARLTSIMIVAKCLGQSIAGGWYHEVSAYVVSFPFAFATLCLLHKALNWHQTPAQGSRQSSPGNSGDSGGNVRRSSRQPEPARVPVAAPSSYDY